MTDEKKKTPKLVSLSVLKDAIFENEALATFAMEWLPFPLEIKPETKQEKIGKNTLAPNDAQLIGSDSNFTIN